MHLHFTPIRYDLPLVIERFGDLLRLNGWAFDFTALAEGEIWQVEQFLPADCPLAEIFAAPVSRKNGVVELSLLLPHGPEAGAELLYPKPQRPAPEGRIVFSAPD